MMKTNVMNSNGALAIDMPVDYLLSDRRYGASKMHEVLLKGREERGERD